jgi:hypothetical protein
MVNILHDLPKTLKAPLISLQLLALKIGEHCWDILA